VKTARSSHRNKASNAVLLNESRVDRGVGWRVKSFRGLDACNLVTVTIVTAFV
jgi:hypothetical protein